MADHNLIETIVNLRSDPRQNTEILKRKCKLLNIKYFQNRIANENWNKIYQIDDPNLAYNFLNEKIRKHLDELILIVKLQPR